MTPTTDGPTMTTQLTDDQHHMIAVTAGVSAREAAKHLMTTTRMLAALNLSTGWLTETYQLLADLAHELDPGITPYPKVIDGQA